MLQLVNLVAGQYLFTLTVEDAEGLTSKDSASLVVNKSKWSAYCPRASHLASVIGLGLFFSDIHIKTASALSHFFFLLLLESKRHISNCFLIFQLF